MLQESRRYPRTEVETHVEVDFLYGGHRFSSVPVAMLGAGGCGFRAPEAMLALMDVLERSTPLEHLVLAHAHLPPRPVRARVAYTAGHDPVMVGVEFMDVPEDYREALAQLVVTLLKPTNLA